MKLDTSNREFNLAVDFINHSNRSLFLTGKAGTGKTTFLKYIKENTDKKMAIVAPTGIAAVNAGGTTIHSFFQIKPSLYTPNDKRLRYKAIDGDADRSTIYDHFKYFKRTKELLREIDILVIDEISMVRCDLLDVISRLLKTFGDGNPILPFGGKQILFIGDAFQLPPIARRDDWNILSRFYESPFFFSSHSFKELDPIFIELQKIYRQSDQVFIDILNRVRIGSTTAEDIKRLNDNISSSNFDFGAEEYVYLGSHNKPVNRTNEEKLQSLKSQLFNYIAEVSGSFLSKDMPTLQTLKLKKGAQVMFVKNDSGEHRRYYNGKIGKVVELDDDSIKVKFSNGEEINVEKTVWYKIKYEWNDKKKEIEETIIGSFTQYPLKLAWAITIHKSQGLTFERVYADLPDSFSEGQVYVALSRCTSLEGLKLKRKISRKCIITSNEVLNFYATNRNKFDSVSNAMDFVKVETTSAPTKVVKKSNIVQQKAKLNTVKDVKKEAISDSNSANIPRESIDEVTKKKKLAFMNKIEELKEYSKIKYSSIKENLSNKWYRQ